MKGTLLVEEFYIRPLDLQQKHICLDLPSLHPRISSRGLLSATSLEQTLPIQEERLLTLLPQEHSSLTQTMLSLHWQQILPQQRKPLKLQMLQELRQISIFLSVMKNSLSDPRLVIKLLLIGEGIIQRQKSMLLAQKSKELITQKQHYQVLVQSV